MTWTASRRSLALVCVLLGVGCAETGEGEPAVPGEPQPGNPGPDAIPLEGGGWDSAGGGDGGDQCEPGQPGAAEGDVGLSGGGDDGGDDGAAGDEGGGDPGGGDGSIGPGSGPGGEPPVNPSAGQLTAGQWSDLDNWPFFQDLLHSPGETGLQQDSWQLFTTQRYPVVVYDGETPVADAHLRLIDAAGAFVWEARTDNTGHAELFAGMFGGATPTGLSIEVTAGDATATLTDVASADEAIEVQLPAAAEPPDLLDLMFVVDTTGSMGDELTYLQAELTDVIDRVQDTKSGGLDVRLSVNFYRDCGDEYVVRSFPFTDDIGQASQWIAEQSAGGGGDYPEAVSQALHGALAEHEWSESARARLLFLVLDAPPHHSPQILERLHAVTRLAADKGVRIIPVASSGVDVPTEFLLRLLAAASGSTYTFLTDDSGIGNDHIEPTIGEFQVELLNDMLVRIIAEAVE